MEYKLEVLKDILKFSDKVLNEEESSLLLTSALYQSKEYFTSAALLVKSNAINMDDLLSLCSLDKEELKNLMEEQNIRIKLDPSGQRGDYSLIRYEGRNSGDVYYNDIVYGQVGVMEFHLIHRLYIPADTEETQEAYIEAATEKLTSAFPDAVVEITYGGTVEALEDMTTEKLEDVGNPTEYYMISINGEIYNFILEKSTEETGFSKTDEVTGVTVETDADISSDAELVVEKITEDKEEYDVLNGLFSNSNFIAFNISLVANGEELPALESGSYTVTIALGSDYVGKTLYAYYVNEGKIAEKFAVIVDEKGNASFNTTHFSTYVLSEENIEVESSTPTEEGITDTTLGDANTVENPQTSDSLFTYVAMFMISIATAMMASKALRKN